MRRWLPHAIPFVALLAVVSLWFVAGAVAQSPLSGASVITFEASADVSVESCNPDKNHDQAGTLYVARDQLPAKCSSHTLVRFELSNLVHVGSVQSAMLRMYLTQAYVGSGTRDMDIARASKSWDEAKVTWTTRPDSLKPMLLRTVDDGAGWRQYDVTELVEGWLVQGLTNDGLILTPNTTGSWMRSFFERSLQHSYDPQLVITYTVGTPTRTATRTQTPVPTATLSPAPTTTRTQTSLPTKTGVPTNTATPTVTPQELPDLVITDLWGEGPLVCYQVQNLGQAAAAAGHSTLLQVNGQTAAQDPVDVALSPGERLNRCFNYSWTCAGVEAKVKATADHQGTVVEGNELNNSREETWRCDTTAPTITSGPTVSAQTETSVLICWDTDEASHSLVRFDKRSGALASWLQHPALVTRHCLTLDELGRDTTYEYVVESCDSGGNCVRSEPKTFGTRPRPESNKPSLNLRIGTTLSGKQHVGADATDDQGVRRVEFWLDNKLVHTDWSMPFGFDCETRRLDDGPHVWLVRVFDVAGNVTETAAESTVRNRFGDELSPVHIRFLDLANGQAVWGDVSIAAEVTHDYSSTIKYVQFEVDGVELSHEDYPPCSATLGGEWGRYVHFPACGTTPLQESAVWRTAGLGLYSEHIVEVHARDESGNWGHASLRLRVDPPDPRVDVTREVNRVNNYFEVTLSVRNRSTEPLLAITVTDRNLGFQTLNACSVSIDGGSFSSPLGYPVAYLTRELSSELVFWWDSLGPGSTMRLRYHAVPILFGGDDYVAGPTIGDDFRLSFEVYGERHNLVPRTSWSSSEERARAFQASNYLIMTNPHRFTCPITDVSKLLCTMAELAKEKLGVLGYLPNDPAMRDPSAVRDLIMPGGEWAGQLGPAFTAPHPTRNEAYLLIVGETEIVPAFTLDISGWDISWSDGSQTTRLKRSDHLYADVVGPDFFPDLTVGRIVGNTAQEMVTPILSSLAVHNGSGFDRSHAVAIGGYESSDSDVFYHNALDVTADLADLGLSTATIQWSNWVDGEWTVPFTHYDALTLGDVDGDGIEELIIAQDADGKIRIVEPMGSETGHFYSVFSRYDGLAAGDLDADGRAEIVVARNDDASFGQLAVYKADGSLVSQITVSFDEWDDLAVGDVLGDGWAGGTWLNDRGRDEVVLIDESTDSVTTYRLTDLDQLHIAYEGAWTGVNFTRHDRMRVGNVRSDWLRDEIVIVRNDDQTIYIYNAVGTELARLGRDVDGDDKRDTRYTLYDGFELADIDGCGRDEILMMCDEDEKLYSIEYWSWAGNWHGSRMYTRLMSDWFIGTRYTGSETRHDGFAAGHVTAGAGERIVVLRNLNGAASTARIVVPLWHDLDRLANERLGDVGANRSIIVVNGHGNPGGASPIGTSFSGEWGTFGQHPFVFSFSCLTGDYEDGLRMDETFSEALFDHGAAAFVGATEVSGANENTPAMRGFFESHWNPDTTRAGKAFTRYERLRADDGIRWKFWIVEYNYYGDPKFGARGIPEGGGSALAAAVAAAPPTTLQVHVPMYNVEQVNGLDVVSLPGGESTSEDYQPQVPMYGVVVTLPLGYRLQDVALTSRGGLYGTLGLSLPIAVPVTDGMSAATAAMAETAEEDSNTVGWFPGRDFDWQVLQEGDGSTSVLVTLYPFQYNRLTTDARFYQDYAFALDYTAPGVTLTHLATEKSTYEPGDPVIVNLGLRAGDTPVDTVVEAAIYTFSGDYVDGLLLRSLPGLTGPAEFSAEWNSAGRAAGDYQVQVKLRTSDGKLLDQHTCTFRLGTQQGELTALTVTPSTVKIGETVYITVEARNSGTTVLAGEVGVAVRRGTTVVADRAQPFADLAPGATQRWSTSWVSAGNPPGVYTVLGRVTYASASDVRAVEMRVKGAASLYLPQVVRRN